MSRMAGTDYYGKKDVVAEYDACSSCSKPSFLASYTTDRFFHLFGLPLIPLGRYHMAHKCPYCGYGHALRHRIYRRQRKKDLAVMMKGFTDDPDNPNVILNALQTLMVHNQDEWFRKVVDTHGARFKDHALIQRKIATGLLRFGQAAEAEVYCQKSIALESHPASSELLTRCQSIRERDEANYLDVHRIKAESLLLPYASITTLAALFVASLIGMGYLATRRHTAWLVSGSPIAYQVEVDGITYPLNPYERKRITLRLGKHKMLAHGLVRQTETIPFKYILSLLEQKRGNHALVLNPDAMAILYMETQTEGTSQKTYCFGKTVHKLDQITHAFTEFPKWTMTGAQQSMRLMNLEPSSAMEAINCLRSNVSSNEASIYATRILEESPATKGIEELLAVVVHDLPVSEAVAYLKNGLETTPPALAWHTFYQDYRKARTPNHNLENEYALRCETSPNVPELYYLLARVARSRNNAKLFYEKSEEGSGCQGAGYYAIARMLFCSARFSEARGYADRALQKDPTHPHFIELDLRIDLALRHYERLLKKNQQMLATDPENSRLMSEQIKYLTLLGQHHLVEKATRSFSLSNSNWSSRFNAARFYTVGNISDYLENLCESEAPDAPWQVALYQGQLHDALQQFREQDAPTAQQALLLYCAARSKRNNEIALFGLKQAVEKSAPDTAQLLARKQPPPHSEVLELNLWPEDKALLCTALGFRFPRYQQTYFRMARQFNHTPDHPQLLIKKWIQQQTKKR